MEEQKKNHWVGNLLCKSFQTEPINQQLLWFGLLPKDSTWQSAFGYVPGVNRYSHSGAEKGWIDTD